MFTFYNPSTHTVSSTSMRHGSFPAAGPIYFYKGIGYIAVGDNTYGNACGVYYFNPSDSVPKAVQIGSKVSAQFIAFDSTTKAILVVRSRLRRDRWCLIPSTLRTRASDSWDRSAKTDAAGLFLGEQIVVGPALWSM